MNRATKRQIVFVLEDDNELMTAALDGDLDDENKRLNRELIKRHNEIMSKLDKSELLSQEDLQLVRDANEIHMNDAANVNGRHKEAVELDVWLDNMVELSMKEAMKILEEWLDKNPKTPARVYRALHTLWEEATPNDVAPEAAFDDEGRCLKCGSKVSFADATDTLVFVGDDIVKRYDGDITNKNCVRCTYPAQYPEYEDYESN
jgi:hypothetical protein